jgi:hypothetical protein
MTEYINQEIIATCLIQTSDIDSFYNPSALSHIGFASDGFYYTNGTKDSTRQASWFTEAPGSYRGTTAAFPAAGLILLSKTSLTILDETTASLNMWMQFILQNSYFFTNNFNGGTLGFTPTGLSYADGIISVTYAPNPGSVDVTTSMVVSLDFSQDKAYLDVSV